MRSAANGLSKGNTLYKTVWVVFAATFLRYCSNLALMLMFVKNI